MNAIDVECPECGAKAGQRCHTLTGKANPVSHAKRKKAAFDQEVLEAEKNETGSKAGDSSKSASQT